MSKNFLEVENLLVNRGDRTILNRVSVSLEAGETLALMGLSGAGKSTMVRCIIGLLHPDGGDIRIKGKSIIGLKSKELDKIRRDIGMVFQSPALFDSMTIFDNVGFSLKENFKVKGEELKERVEKALKAVDLGDTGELLPNQLSGGMQKRAGIARAIVTNPEMLLFDEPTSGLDPIMSSIINDLINNMKRQLSATSIVVTHDLKSAYSVADKIALLYEGNFIECGSVESFKKSKHPVVRQFIEGSSIEPVKI